MRDRKKKIGEREKRKLERKKLEREEEVDPLNVTLYDHQQLYIQ